MESPETASDKHSSENKRNFLPLLFGFFFILGCLLHYQRGYFNNSPNYLHVLGSDDAYITYRYGWNLAHYNTLSWNESGFRRTEGFTNPLWVLLSAAWAFTNNKDFVYPGVTFTSVILTAFLLVVLAYRIQKKTTKKFALVGIFLLSASPVVWSHTTSGMESGVFGALIGLIAYIFIFEMDKRMIRWGGILVIFSILLRSDGFIYMLILAFALLVTGSHSWKQSFAGLVSGSLILFTWRMFTFGTLLPNTAVAKLNFPLWESSIIGIQFLVFLSPGIIPLILFGLQGVLRLENRKKISSLLVVSGWLAYYVRMGGDTYSERHIVGTIFFLAVLASFQFESMRLGRKQKYLFVLILLLSMSLPVFAGDSRFEYWKQKPSDPWILFGKEMSKNRAEYGVTVTSSAGKIPFFAGDDFVDELGLNDPYLAKIRRATFVPGHSAGNREVAIEIAESESEVVSCFVFGGEVRPEDQDRVLIWIDNVHPEQGIQYLISEDSLALVRNSQPLGHTFILRIAR